MSFKAVERIITYKLIGHLLARAITASHFPLQDFLFFFNAFMQLKPFSEPSPFAVDIIIQRGALNDKQNDSVRRAKFLIFALAF